MTDATDEGRNTKMRVLCAAAAAATMLAAGAAGAQVTRDNFLLRNAGDLVAVCGVAREDPNATAAIHFCHGFFVGLDRFAEATGRPFRGSLYCPPENLQLTRTQFAGMVVDWHRKNPQFAAEGAFDGVARMAAATWPCKK